MWRTRRGSSRSVARMLRGQPSTERRAWYSRPRDQYRETPGDRCARLFFAFLSAQGLTVRHLTCEVIVGQKHSRHVRVAHLVDASLAVADPHGRVWIVPVAGRVIEDRDLMEDGSRRQERRCIVGEKGRDLPVEVEAID